MKLSFVIFAFLLFCCSCKKEPIDLLTGTWYRKSIIYLTNWDQPLDFSIVPDTCYFNSKLIFFGNGTCKSENPNYTRCNPLSSSNGNNFDADFELYPDNNFLILRIRDGFIESDTLHIVSLTKFNFIFKEKYKYPRSNGTIGYALLFQH